MGKFSAIILLIQQKSKMGQTNGTPQKQKSLSKGNQDGAGAIQRDEKLDFLYSLIKDDIPRLTKICERIMRYEDQRGQIFEFCRLLFKDGVDDSMQSLSSTTDQRFLLGQAIFTAFLPSTKSQFNLDTLV
ncbi:hypothetical protein FGO68_gene11448 [Halteria grandinella]|uniref:Uncharacterized protein n=1 Tax=Halteria grandinella TaxID=5974 RepID=A0A8J8SVH8_HALGN|nr:hypothetical protein FGO68_gene11448 [Halteria grandinella]